MILHLTFLLVFQLVGEVATRALGLPIPGPVLGMALFFACLVAIPRLADTVRPTAQGLLAHLSLLFVPAGVGVVGHVDRLGQDGVAVLLAIVVSTVLAIVAGVAAFLAVSRLIGPNDA